MADRGEEENDRGPRGQGSPPHGTELSLLQILREMSAFDVTYTAVVISHSGRMLFVGTSVGTIRAMKYPLPVQKEFNGYQAHAGPVTKVRGDPLSSGPVPGLAISGPVRSCPPRAFFTPSTSRGLSCLLFRPAVHSVDIYWLLTFFV